MDKVSAIILAAGSGSRFGAKKQFKKLNKKPIWVYSLNTFIRSEPEGLSDVVNILSGRIYTEKS